MPSQGVTTGQLIRKHHHETLTLKQQRQVRRAILIAVLVALFILFIAFAAGIFGTKEQLSRAKDILPIVVSLITPLLTAIIAVYLPKTS